MTRSDFLRLMAGGLASAMLARPLLSEAMAAAGGYDFWFTRLRYESGDWDVDQRMPSNVITSLIDYTTLRVDPKEHVLALSDPKMLTAPFCYLAGHKLVEFSPAERRNFERYVRNGGFVLVDDCNHDIDGLFARSFEAQMARIFGAKAMKTLPKNHGLYRSFFTFDGPPNTGLELNGWGDDLVHDYLKGIEVNGRLGVLYSNKDYGCEWDYDWRNKRFLAEDNTKFAVNIVMYALSV
ncbi:MAG: twin-arginine translocation pathway signal [Sphingomonadales bacterium RIFCSPLOWO2_12_FULL_63_15]|nr:MAG: twin-arginine translocation pathway signal [Sphingomonadales bacterium RIFCSPLOWO2_12_FULL_63_15]